MQYSVPSCPLPEGLVRSNPLVGQLALAPPARRARGLEAEEAAINFYQSQGCRVLAKNWRFRKYEVDLILAEPDGGTWLAVEVKFQSRLTDFAPWNRSQLHRIQRAAAAFGRKNQYLGSWRIDLVRCHGSPVRVVEVREGGWPGI